MNRLHYTLLLVFLSVAIIFGNGCSSSGGDANSTTSLTSANDNPYPSPEDNYTGLRAGFGQVPILTVNDNVKGYWMAGFSIVRPVSGIHDSIYANAVVIDNGEKRLAIISLDAFSLRYEDTEYIRNAVQSLGIDNLMVHSVHNHQVPDNSGMWSFIGDWLNDILHFQIMESSVDIFSNILRAAAIQSVREASKNLVPADMYIGQVMDKDRLDVPDPSKVEISNDQDTAGIDQLQQPNELGVTRLRPPYIMDNGIRFAVFKTKDGKNVIGSIVNWDNHVETIWRINQMISADFVGYLRDALHERLGGNTVYITGNVGVITVPEYEPELFFNKGKNQFEEIDITPGVLYDGTLYYGSKSQKEATIDSPENFKKAWALGNAVADIIIDEVKYGNMELNADPAINVITEKFDIGFQNQKFLLARNVGILKREGHTADDGSSRTWTEMDLITIGDLWLLTIPGELYPEIAIGPIGVPENRDYNGTKKKSDGLFNKVLLPDVSSPVETLLRPMMQGKVNMMMNLGNDHLGYLIPKTEWNELEPYTYGYTHAPYGEENSLGPDAAKTICDEALILFRKANDK
jgi:hypothetical protein